MRSAWHGLSAPAGGGRQEVGVSGAAAPVSGARVSHGARVLFKNKREPRAESLAMAHAGARHASAEPVRSAPAA